MEKESGNEICLMKAILTKKSDCNIRFPPLPSQKALYHRVLPRKIESWIIRAGRPSRVI
jgi:hypothetical protein